MSSSSEAASPFLHSLRNGRAVALGRPRPSLYDDPRTVRRFALRALLDRPTLPPLQPSVGRPSGYTPRMFGNDRLGDCTCAAVANLALLSSARAGKPAPAISDADVIGLYEQVGGYKPGDPSTDQGAVELDVLNHWRHNPFAGVGLAAFAAIEPGDLEMLRYGVQLFGAVYVGLALPTSAQDQVGHTWDVAEGMVPGSWGGHAVILSAFDYRGAAGVWQCETWGAEQALTEAFWRGCGDEAYAPLPDDYANVPGLDYAVLQAELGQLGKLTA